MGGSEAAKLLAPVIQLALPRHSPGHWPRQGPGPGPGPRARARARAQGPGPGPGPRPRAQGQGPGTGEALDIICALKYNRPSIRCKSGLF